KRERAHTFRSGRQALAGRGQRSVAEVSVFSCGVIFSSRHIPGAFVACGWLSVAVQAAAAVVASVPLRVAASLWLARLLALRVLEHNCQHQRSNRHRRPAITSPLLILHDAAKDEHSGAVSERPGHVIAARNWSDTWLNRSAADLPCAIPKDTHKRRH